MADPLQPPPIDVPQQGPDGLFATVWQRFFISLRAVATLWQSQPFVTYKATTNLTGAQNLGLLVSGYLKAAVSGAVSTISSIVTIPVTDGGTGAGTFTAHGVLLGEGTSPIGVTAVGATLSVLTGVTGFDPVFSASPSLTGLTVDSPTFFVDSVNHRVGIGTIIPAGGTILNVSSLGGTKIRVDAGSSTGFASIQVVDEVFTDAVEILMFGTAAVGTWFGLPRAGSAFVDSSPVALLGIGTRNITPVIFGSSDLERMRLHSNGNLGIGVTFAETLIGDGILTVKSSLANGYADTTIRLRNVGSSGQGYLAFDHLGGTEGTPTAVPANTIFGSIVAVGYNGTSMVHGSEILLRALNLWSGTDNSSYMTFYTVKSGATAQFTTLQLGIDGQGSANFFGTLDASAANVASLTTLGGLGVTKKSWLGDLVTIQPTSDTRSSALRINRASGSEYAELSDFAGITVLTSKAAAPSIFLQGTTDGSTYTTLAAFTTVGVGIGTITVPTASLHLPAGTATANTAPLKLTSGTLLTAAEAGAVEFLTDAFYGTITTGPTRKQFAMIDAASVGAASEMAKIDTTGLTANVGATTLYSVPASGEGFYRVNAYVVETTAGSLSSVLPNVQVVYTDKDSNTSVTLDVTPILGIAGIGQTGALSANAIGTVSSGVVPIYVKASTTIQYQTVNYASNLAGMTYALRIRLELL